ncbi:MAG: hypothetical protein K6F99_09355, partial [Lachnospiraceae bacterium]|nr:hypothetical protein [Lachnospiraceae bacterium]
DIDDVESYSFMKRVVTDADITDLSSSTTDETTVDHVYDEVYRLRLAYDNIDTSSEGGTFSAQRSDGTSFDIIEVSDDASIPTSDGKIVNPTAIYLNTTTGNMVFGAVVRSQLAAGELSITYDKSEWQVGDLKPEHYFKCTEKGKKNTSIDYNSDPTGYNQKINFTVSEGQQITINTNANELFVHAVGRDVEELELAIEDVNAAQKKVDKLKAMQEDTVTYGESDQERIALLLNAANKELDYATQKMTKMFSNGVTKAQEYFDAANLAGTTTGTSASRLTIIKNRLSENKATVTTQASDNENVEISDVTVEVSAAQLAYNAALIATGKIAQQSLVNYI